MSSGYGNRNLVAALCYLLGFVTGAVILFTEEHDKLIRFHAMQSILATGGLFVLNIIVGIVLGRFPAMATISDIASVLIWLLILVICIMGFVWAFQGRFFKLIIVGDIAERKVGN